MSQLKRPATQPLGLRWGFETTSIFLGDTALKIKVIIPVSTGKWNTSVGSDYEQCKQPETIVEIAHLQHGPEAIQSEYNEAVAAAHVLKEVSQTRSPDYNAIIIYCFSDPALYGAREISSIPVLGIGESSQLFTMSLADRCGIITTLDQSVSRIRRKISGRGFSNRFPSVRPLGIPVLDYDQKDKVTRRALEVARQMVEQDGIEALILGCGSLFGVKEQIAQEFMIPVVEPGTVTLKHAEALITLGLSHSKKSYMVPLPVKEK
jgi:allantoin racemase